MKTRQDELNKARLIYILHLARIGSTATILIGFFILLALALKNLV